ncbi:DUF3549 family protein [Halomonas sp. PR-M31]|uniref:DUF3549 family protein n=1 Tax=Halomonas sp. PR-M31 TaxID=1471202 RepID=UPI000650BC6F|nr:DUF3549 family protein [Halomonas sp. PR-M31]
MQPIHALGEFFERIGAPSRFYTLGRQVTPCPASTLKAFEAGELAWPWPWLDHAQLACVFQVGNGDDPLIWFLSLPLDEQGLLDPAPRDAFLQRVLETIGRTASLQVDDSTERVNNLMQDNPLTFTPHMTQRAMLHAYVSDDLAREASEHFELAEAYLTGQLANGQWQALGLQGLADFVVRHDAQQSNALAARLDALPLEVLRPLCHCLEHKPLSTTLTQALIARGERAAQEGDVETFCNCVRAVGQGNKSTVGVWYDELLEDQAACGPDLFAAIAARGWPQLEDAKRLPHFIERLAENENADFAVLIRSLALIPRLRLPLLISLRQAAPETRTRQRLSELSFGRI